MLGACAATPRPTERSGDLQISCSPGDALVSLDAVPQATCEELASGKGLQAGPGTHRVEVSKPGYWPKVSYYESDGLRATLRMHLVPKDGADGGSS